MALYPCTVGGNQPRKLGTYTGNQSAISIKDIPNFRSRTFYLANIVAPQTSASELAPRHLQSVASVTGTTMVLTKNGNSISVTGAVQSVLETTTRSEGATSSDPGYQNFTYDIYYV